MKYIEKPLFDRLLGLQIEPILKTKLFAEFCRVNILYMIAKAGSGHIGSSFSSIDILSWLFINELEGNGQGNDIFFSSKGHDVPAKYSVLLALGYLDSELIHKLRRLDGLPGHPDVSIPLMHTNTGSLGMGISKARGIALAKRLKGEPGRVFVLTGDGELQEGQFWESLQPTANRRLEEITVIVDHNKIQSDTYLEHTSDLGDLECKIRSFGWHVERVDGHDLKQLRTALSKTKSIKDKPKLIIADTIKGAGVSFMHGDLLKKGELYGYHSGAPKVEDYQKAFSEIDTRIQDLLNDNKINLTLTYDSVERPVQVQPEKAQKLISAYSSALLESASANQNLVALDADLVLDTGLIPFKKKFPERFFECGIAEQDMVSQAGGMALQGLLPIVHSFACFLSSRPNEQIFNNATERTKVIYVGSLAGILPAGPGHSHQCVRDISSLSAIPNMLMAEPSCEAEVSQLLDILINQHDYCSYLRLTSIPCQIPYELPNDYHAKIGKGIALTKGDDAVIFAYGPVLLTAAYQAALNLAKQNFNVKVVNLPWLNTVDTRWLAETIDNAPIVVALDNHFTKGGQGEYLLSQLAKLNISTLAHTAQLGIDDIPLCGGNDEVLGAHKLDAQSISSYMLSIAQIQSLHP